MYMLIHIAYSLITLLYNTILYMARNFNFHVDLVLFFIRNINFNGLVGITWSFIVTLDQIILWYFIYLRQ